MVYKVLGKNEKSTLFWQWSKNSLRICMDGTLLPYKDIYTFDYEEVVKNNQLKDIPDAIHFWKSQNENYDNCVYIYSNYTERDVRDLIKLLEKQDFISVIFLREI